MCRCRCHVASDVDHVLVDEDLVGKRPFADAAAGHELSVEMPDATTASDWLPTFEFGMANDSSCLKRPARVSGAEGRFTLKLDARQSSSRWQPPALNVDRPTAAFEASELSLSTRSGRPRFRKPTLISPESGRSTIAMRGRVNGAERREATLANGPLDRVVGGSMLRENYGAVTQRALYFGTRRPTYLRARYVSSAS